MTNTYYTPPHTHRSECGRDLFIEQQMAEKRKSYAPLLHEGGVSMARQRFQISVMKAMISRTDAPGERVRRASLTVVAQSKFDSATRRASEELGEKGADSSHCISVKPKVEGGSPTKKAGMLFNGGGGESPDLMKDGTDRRRTSSATPLMRTPPRRGAAGRGWRNRTSCSRARG